MNAGIVIFDSVDSSEEVSFGRADIVNEQTVLSVEKSCQR